MTKEIDGQFIVKINKESMDSAQKKMDDFCEKMRQAKQALSEAKAVMDSLAPDGKLNLEMILVTAQDEEPRCILGSD